MKNKQYDGKRLSHLCAHLRRVMCERGVETRAVSEEQAVRSVCKGVRQRLCQHPVAIDAVRVEGGDAAIKHLWIALSDVS